MEPLKKDYCADECPAEYRDTEQRWLVVYSLRGRGAGPRWRLEQVRREHEEEAKAFSEL
jgi:hypothetical protein